MNQGTFKAAIALIEQRWPFPAGAEEHQSAYLARLKLAVSSWSGKREDGFKRAIDALVAATNQRGRPSPEQIVELSLSRAGESTSIGRPPPTDPRELARDREERHAAWRAECERRRADPEEAQRSVDSFARGAMFWRAGSRERKHIAEWLRDFWGVDFQPGEYEAVISAPSTQKARNPVRVKASDELPESEPVPVGAVAEALLAAGPSGLSDAALGSAEDDKARRRQEHRERVGEAISDWQERRRGREPGEDE